MEERQSVRADPVRPGEALCPWGRGATGASYMFRLAPKAAALAALHPVFLELYVPVDGLARARKELAEPGSRLRGVYEEAVKILER